MGGMLLSESCFGSRENKAAAQRAVGLCGDQQCCVLLHALVFSSMDFYLVPLTPREEIFSSEEKQ